MRPSPTPLSTTKDMTTPSFLSYYMPDFKRRPGTKSAYRPLKLPFANITAFDETIRSLLLNNPLGCTSYFHKRKHIPPILKVREMYTAKFEYRNVQKKRIGTTIEMYDSVEGYETGIASVISNMANIASHRGRPRHLPAADLFAVTLKCHDQNGELYYLSLARDRMTVSSYSDDDILRKVRAWEKSVPALA